MHEWNKPYCELCGLEHDGVFQTYARTGKRDLRAHKSCIQRDMEQQIIRFFQELYDEPF